MAQQATVPLIDLQAQYAGIREQVLAAVTRVCDSQRFIMGPEVDAFEREMTAMLRVRHAVGVSSGTDALVAALMALKIGPGDEVVTSPYSFFATAGSIARLGARPVFVDIDPVTFNLDVSKLEAACTPATRAIIPVHLYGLMSDMTPLMDVARRRALPVVEDAAQAIGAHRGGCSAGSAGDIGCFSFFPTKNLGAFGDAGLVTTNDEALGHALRLIRVHGSEPKYFHKMIGGNFRMDAIQAAVLRVKAPHLAGWTEGRRRNARKYREFIGAAGLDRHVTVPVEPSDAFHIYHQFVIRVEGRDTLRTHLRSRGVETEIYYPVPLHLQECFAPLGYQNGAFPHAEAAARDTLALPIYSELTDAQLAHVVDAMAEFFG
ncbi:MAG TPA: DegT/DnrJ/EryC1/StrS family aminotransferase [Vicinamibacterales bacterium]|nr:DegT/DnrJ/EryC1/StrS family aminotransferase [Vicinamibacterales bacterium]